MSRWQRLRAEIDDARRNSQAYSATPITSVVQRLGKQKHCSSVAVGWITTTGLKGRYASISWMEGYANALDNRGHPALRLHGLSFLDDKPPAPEPDDPHAVKIAHLLDGPVLSMQITLDDKKRVHSYGIGIEGIRRAIMGHPPHARWYARVDLTEVPEGQGDCGHPLLHCHVGDDPEAGLSPRTPAPWLLPHEAMEWLLATVEPMLEP